MQYIDVILGSYFGTDDLCKVNKRVNPLMHNAKLYVHGQDGYYTLTQCSCWRFKMVFHRNKPNDWSRNLHHCTPTLAMQWEVLNVGHSLIHNPLLSKIS